MGKKQHIISRGRALDYLNAKVDKPANLYMEHCNMFRDFMFFKKGLDKDLTIVEKDFKEMGVKKAINLINKMDNELVEEFSIKVHTRPLKMSERFKLPPHFTGKIIYYT